MVLNLLTALVEQRHIVPTGCLVVGTIPHFCVACAWNVVSLPLPTKLLVIFVTTDILIKNCLTEFTESASLFFFFFNFVIMLQT